MVTHNAFIERFNRTCQQEFLDAYLFAILEQVREITEEWIKDYNEERRHTAKGKLPPVQNWQHPKPAEISLFGLHFETIGLFRPTSCNGT